MPYFYRNNIKYSGGSDSVDLTMAEYKELEANGKVVQDITYYIIDADENIPSRPNLLINSNFANPVNQRGITAETWSNEATSNPPYGFDRWRLGSSIVSSIDNGITFQSTGGDNNGLAQFVEFGVEDGKTYSLSACIDGKIISGTTVATSSGLCTAYEDDSVRLFLAYSSSRAVYGFYIRFKDTNQHTVTWAKLELGNYATPYAPRLYQEEWLLCQRYYQNYSFSYVFAFNIKTAELYFGLVNKAIPTRTIPKFTIKEATVMSDSTPQTGFTISVQGGSTIERYVLVATKNSHNLTFGKAWIYGTLLLDAEIY